MFDAFSHSIKCRDYLAIIDEINTKQHLPRYAPFPTRHMSSLHHHNDLTGYSLGDHNITSTSGVSKIKAATNQKVVAKGEYDRQNHREVYTSLIHSGYVFEKLKFVFSSFDILSFNEKCNNSRESGLTYKWLHRE